MTDISGVACQGLIKVHHEQGLEVVALQGLDFEALPGEMLALVGPSGSGKSSLLMILAGQDEPTAGKAWVAGLALHEATDAERRQLRRNRVSLVFQDPPRNLLPKLTVGANVALPMALGGMPRRQARDGAAELLGRVGLSERTGERIEHLSGGEQQRVAVAVALATDPPVLLADEPTAELDVGNSERVIDLLESAAADGRTVVVTTHDPDVAARAHRVVYLRDGRVEGLSTRGTDEQLLAVDSKGRVQLPAALLAEAGIIDRTRARLEDGRIILEKPE
jgi:ABC-type lipoprotein export system ATPase subunit